MSSIGSPLQTSLLQAAQAQLDASRSRDREKTPASESARRYADQLDLRVAGVEGDDAVRKLPGNDSEQAAAERRARRKNPPPSPPREERVDLTA